MTTEKECLTMHIRKYCQSALFFPAAVGYIFYAVAAFLFTSFSIHFIFYGKICNTIHLSKIFTSSG